MLYMAGIGMVCWYGMLCWHGMSYMAGIGMACWYCMLYMVCWHVIYGWYVGMVWQTDPLLH